MGGSGISPQKVDRHGRTRDQTPSGTEFQTQLANQSIGRPGCSVSVLPIFVARPATSTGTCLLWNGDLRDEKTRSITDELPCYFLSLARRQKNQSRPKRMGNRSGITCSARTAPITAESS